MAHLALSVVGAAIIIIGLVVMIGGVLGLLRFPDVYTRVHAVNASDGVGAALVAGGLALTAEDGGVALRLLLLALLLLALAPTLAQLIASAAHGAGLAPLAGRYVAPRPSARRDEDL